MQHQAPAEILQPRPAVVCPTEGIDEEHLAPSSRQHRACLHFPHVEEPQVVEEPGSMSAKGDDNKDARPMRRSSMVLRRQEGHNECQGGAQEREETMQRVLTAWQHEIVLEQAERRGHEDHRPRPSCSRRAELGQHVGHRIVSEKRPKAHRAGTHRDAAECVVGLVELRRLPNQPDVSLPLILHVHVRRELLDVQAGPLQAPGIGRDGLILVPACTRATGTYRLRRILGLRIAMVRA
mmetsp:Transcript_60478/g.129749  ORF Transcript_60478/g.129749 Transcript_60478/m.129749 type:complete len:237 (+) Transcript_60478:1443-2153(+)